MDNGHVLLQVLVLHLRILFLTVSQSLKKQLIGFLLIYAFVSPMPMLVKLFLLSKCADLDMEAINAFFPQSPALLMFIKKLPFS